MAEKTEQPTDKKRRDARRDGQVAHSQDIGQLLGFAAALLFFWMAGDRLLAALGRLLLAPSRLPPDAAFGRQLSLLARYLGTEAALAVVPLLGVMLVCGVAADLLQNGPLFTPKRIVPSFGKLNIWSNVKTRFAVPAWIDLLKMIAKTGLLLGVASIVLRGGIADILRLGDAPPLTAWRLSGDLLRVLGMAALVLLVPVALLDLHWQRAQLTRKLKMSIDEVRREYKQTEGAPEIKGERRRRHQELSTEEIRSRVKRSSVVVVNPVHYAVGLRYEAGVTPLP
ncbi:MAG: EscU/YscU/HrcU family type III secretion system export apparatus switch protein, partial [Janthinobacterium lividum]